MRREIWRKRLEKRLKKIERELLDEWRPLGESRFGWWGGKCVGCKQRTCEGCEPLLMLVVRQVYKPGYRLALYGPIGFKPVADGDEEVRKFLEERGIPLPPVFE
jgi:hypothetical protein